MSLPATLGEAMALARGQIPQSEARLLLCEACGVSAATIIGFPERGLAESAASQFVDWLSRRAQGEPVAYLLGRREFFGRPFRVSPAVLIPRPETELLLELALARIPETAVRVLDLGTGSGAIAISLALERPDVEVHAVDLSDASLEVARGNAAALGASVRWHHGSWFAPLAGERFDLIVSNPPYVASADPHLARGDVRFEPIGALASGPDGLDDIRAIAAAAPRHLKASGHLLFEHGYDQGAGVRAVMEGAGFAEVATHQDLAGLDRVTLGRLHDAALMRI
ncbi:peptide chain release factor N(5)-glutamine methyltransferase [Niveibacterium sp. 24ML]|uniref:peptide chain release factor N(5)-glutamine methyltransferase n=1 Tax=Niveibacterium sp. 24ML TaxID=2985512 RepID=UPI00226E3EEB|nr:peptide chain release factor N(5)-glutamine methyltransferase [Niveibacterium sp. 24ML]MCX9154600.1 peptide chain release factor N(5)-glutamine methyltransferase [Niveibacterium sp. 24ML]